MDDDGEAPLDDFVEAHETRVVDVHALRVRVELEAVQPEGGRALHFGLHVLEVGVHGAEPDELGVRVALRGDEVVDVWN